MTGSMSRAETSRLPRRITRDRERILSICYNNELIGRMDGCARGDIQNQRRECGGPLLFFFCGFSSTQWLCLDCLTYYDDHCQTLPSASGTSVLAWPSMCSHGQVCTQYWGLVMVYMTSLRYHNRSRENRWDISKGSYQHQNSQPRRTKFLNSDKALSRGDEETVKITHQNTQ